MNEGGIELGKWQRWAFLLQLGGGQRWDHAREIKIIQNILENNNSKLILENNNNSKHITNLYTFPNPRIMAMHVSTITKSNFSQILVKFQCIQAQNEKISMLAPFIGQSVWSQLIKE